MGQLGKRHKEIPITLACRVFPLSNFTVDLVGTNIERCGMQFVTVTFAPTYLLNNTVETILFFKEGATTSKY